MLGFACHVVRGFPSIAPCLEHVCAGGGGSVAFEGFVLLPAGIVLCNLILCYLCKMVYVISGMNVTEEVRQLTCTPESGR